MDTNEHYRKADRLLQRAGDRLRREGARDRDLDTAQVHAELMIALRLGDLVRAVERIEQHLQTRR